MKITDRQKQIIQILQESKTPINGDRLGERFNVSRQIIVKDISILKALGIDIISSNKGYKLSYEGKITRIIKSKHEDKDIKKELNTIIDNGGIIKDVFITHEVYGVIRKELDIHSRNGVNNFVKNINKTTPLKNLTGNIHYHTIIADDIETIEKIENALFEKNFLD